MRTEPPQGHHRRRIFSLSLGDWLDDEVPIEWLAEMLDTIRQCDQVTWILCTKGPENFTKRLVAAMQHNEDTGGNPKAHEWMLAWCAAAVPPPNIILLTSVENQAMADKRIPELQKIPAACRGFSFEPLLSGIIVPDWTGISWAIIGAESGPLRRYCSLAWVQSLVEQGKAAGVAVFVKQLSINGKVSHDPKEWPEWARVRQWPKGF